MNIDEMEGAELDRLAFDLGLAPDDGVDRRVLYIKHEGAFTGEKMNRFEGWTPSTDIAQAVEMADRNDYELKIVRCCSGSYEVTAILHDEEGYLVGLASFIGESFALTLTRACCKAAQMRKEGIQET